MSARTAAALTILGAALITTGIALIYLPAAFMAAGGMCAAAGLLLDIGRRR